MKKTYTKFYNSDFLRYYTFITLISLIILNSVLYLFLVNLGVSEIFLKKEALHKLSDIKEENQNLDGAYLAEFKKINVQNAHEQGFVDANAPLFVNRTSVVALNN